MRENPMIYNRIYAPWFKFVEISTGKPASAVVAQAGERGFTAPSWAGYYWMEARLVYGDDAERPPRKPVSHPEIPLDLDL